MLKEKLEAFWERQLDSLKRYIEESARGAKNLHHRCTLGPKKTRGSDDGRESLGGE